MFGGVALSTATTAYTYRNTAFRCRIPVRRLADRGRRQPFQRRPRRHAAQDEVTRPDRFPR